MGCFLSSVPLSAVWSVIFTVDPTEAGRTGTGVAVDAVSTVGSVLARVALTLIYVLLALCAPKAGQTGTQEAMHLVTTEASIAARVCWGEGTEHDTQLVFQAFAKDNFTFLYSTLIIQNDQRETGETYWACSRQCWFRSCVQ